MINRRFCLSLGLFILISCSVSSRKIPIRNEIWDDDYFGLDFEEPHQPSAGPERIPIDMFGKEEADALAAGVAEGVAEAIAEDIVEREAEKGKLFPTDVDEETIRKAEKIADQDLLNGLNRMLRNNETLRDVFKAENV